MFSLTNIASVTPDTRLTDQPSLYFCRRGSRRRRREAARNVVTFLRIFVTSPPHYAPRAQGLRGSSLLKQKILRICWGNKKRISPLFNLISQYLFYITSDYLTRTSCVFPECHRAPEPESEGWMKSDARFVRGVPHNLWVSDLCEELNEFDVLHRFVTALHKNQEWVAPSVNITHPCSLLKIQMLLICFRAGDPWLCDRYITRWKGEKCRNVSIFEKLLNLHTLKFISVKWS